jgi:hypothetical protein
MSGPIRYSLGKRREDAFPVQYEASDFDAFETAVRHTRSVSKGQHYVAGPFAPDHSPDLKPWQIGRPHRSNAFALPRRFLAFDLDGCRDLGAFHDILAFFDGSYRAFWYTTASHTDESPRARVIVELAREVSPEDGERLGHAVEARIRTFAGDDCAKFDTSVYGAAQPVYTPLFSAQGGTLPGDPLPVDDFLRDAPPAKARNRTADERARAIESSDPVVSVLRDQGAILRELGPGKLAVVCPFDSEHSGQTSDTATVYYLPHFGGFRAGGFHCLHEHCHGRPQEQFRERLGLVPQDAVVPRVGHFREALLAGLRSAELPAPAHLLDRLLPLGVPSLLGGDGGTGKSNLALALVAHAACGREWAGLQMARTRAVYVSLEDDERLVLWRLRRIAAAYDLPLPEVIAGVRVLVVTDEGDATLAVEQSHQGVRELVMTRAFDELAASLNGEQLVVVDNASDAFAGDEINRRQVRAFMRALGNLARRHTAAVVVLAHVDKQAAKHGGAGHTYSGSTAWSTTARSRMALVPNEGGGVDLIHEKANLGPKAEPIALEWCDGVLMPRVRSRLVEGIAANNDADALLRALTAAALVPVVVPSAMSGPVQFTHALEALPEFSRAFTGPAGMRRARAALMVLLRDGRVRAVEYTAPNRHRRSRLEVVGTGAGEAESAPEGASKGARLIPPIPPSAFDARGSARVGCASSDAAATSATSATGAEAAEVAP